MMKQPDDFLHDLYEEPRSEFVDALWRELSSQDQPQETNLNITISSNDHVPTIARIKKHETRRRLSLVATLAVLILGAAFVAALALEMKSGGEGIHIANLSGAITPTVSPEIEATPTPGIAVQEDQNIDLGLMSGEGNPPDRTVTLQVSPMGTWLILSNAAPSVRLAVHRENIPDTTINFELASFVSDAGLILRVSRYNGSEIQPLIIYKPVLLASMKLELPAASDEGWTDDLIIELMTPLPDGKEIVLTVYSGNVRPWPFHRGELCENFPDYCVPLAGGGRGNFASFESPDVRPVDAASSGEPGVVRGLTATGTPFIGKPLRPQVAVFLDFACLHCGDYFLGDLQQFIKDYVLTGKVSLELVLTTGTGGEIAELAAQTALAAGEQGAFWEMVSTLFAYGVTRSTFTLEEVHLLAVSLDLNADALVEAVESERYKPLVDLYTERAQQYKINAVPTVMVQRAIGTGWQIFHDRSYMGLAAWADELANAIIIPPGMVAVTLPLDPELVDQVAYGIQPDDLIDIWFKLDELSPEMREEIGITYPENLLAFEDVLVVEIGSYIPDEEFVGIMLVLPPDDAELLAKLVDVGADFSIVLADGE